MKRNVLVANDENKKLLDSLIVVKFLVPDKIQLPARWTFKFSAIYMSNRVVVPWIAQGNITTLLIARD